MYEKHVVGKLGEEIAEKYLTQNNYKIIEKNFSCSFGEIDIIAKINEELVFIEVKSRSNVNFGYPSEAVDYMKIRKIVNTAKYYMLKNNINNAPIRFDVIEIYLKYKKINHIVNAF